VNDRSTFFRIAALVLALVMTFGIVAQAAASAVPMPCAAMMQDSSGQPTPSGDHSMPCSPLAMDCAVCAFCADATPTLLPPPLLVTSFSRLKPQWTRGDEEFGRTIRPALPPPIAIA